MTDSSSARAKLTLWYVAIIAIVSLTFSAIVYQNVTSEIEGSFKRFNLRVLEQTRQFTPRNFVIYRLEDDLAQAKRAVLLRLFHVNLIIISSSAIAAYILAGKTIEPLEEALEKEKRFTADAGHELKTPLTALRTELEVALRDKNLKLKDAKALLKSNLEEVVSLQNLTENLLTLTRFSQNRKSPHFTQLNIKDVLENSIKKVSPMAKAKAIKIKKDIISASIKADAQSLEELFVILLDNAIKYSHENSIVKIRSMLQRNKVAVEVIDEGVGIAKKDLPRLFDRFYRADPSRNKNKVNGHGLGLSIAKQIVERHNGEISVESEVGKGSTFKVTLPVQL